MFWRVDSRYSLTTTTANWVRSFFPIFHQFIFSFWRRFNRVDNSTGQNGCFVCIDERRKKGSFRLRTSPLGSRSTTLWILTLSIYGQQQVNGSVMHSIDMHIGAVYTTRKNLPKKKWLSFDRFWRMRIEAQQALLLYYTTTGRALRNGAYYAIGPAKRLYVLFHQPSQKESINWVKSNILLVKKMEEGDSDSYLCTRSGAN